MNFYSYVNNEKLFLPYRSFKTINSEFNKLYLKSREKIHAITENPSENMMKNMKQYLQQNNKFLTNCFNENDLYLNDIMDMVTERLTYESEVYITKNIDDYLSASTRGNYAYGKQQ